MIKIRCPLSTAARQYSEEQALVSDERVISYGEYETLVASVATNLIQKRITAGQQVAIISENRWEDPIILLAAFRLGIVVCPVNPALPELAIRSYLSKIGCTTAIASADFTDIGLERMLSFGDLQWSHLTSTQKTILPTKDITCDLDQPGTIIQTSGSSGKPKAVLHSLGNHYYSALGSNENITFGPGDRWLLSLPLYHVGGLAVLFRSLLGGGAVVIPIEGESITESIEKHDITHLSLVSTQLHRMLNVPLNVRALKRLQVVLVGGSSVPVFLISRGLEAGLPIFITYGSTEMASQVTTTASGETQERMRSSGKLLNYRNLKLDDDGEILVRGRTLFCGYAEANGLTRPPLDAVGWYHTGDVGRLDSSGYLTVVGRKDGMFISGGENIYPEEIETALCSLPGVLQAIVVPVEDAEFGYRPVAFVHLQSEAKSPKERSFPELQHLLPRFKIPVAVYDLPSGEGSGHLKSDRNYLTRLAAELHSIRIN